MSSIYRENVFFIFKRPHCVLYASKVILCEETAIPCETFLQEVKNFGITLDMQETSIILSLMRKACSGISSKNSLTAFEPVA